MSYSQIIGINFTDKKTYVLKELRNSWGGAALIWDLLYNKYCKDYNYEYDNWLIDKKGKLWKLTDKGRKDVNVNDRLILAMTYDKIYVGKENFTNLAKEIELFLDRNPINPNSSNHIPEIARVLKEESRSEIEGIGFYWTSVADNPFLGKWNEEKEDHEDLDFSQLMELYEWHNERN